MTSITPLTDDRYTLELPPDDRRSDAIGDLARHGVKVVSVNPIRTTLEDYFVSTVRRAPPRDTSGLALMSAIGLVAFAVFRESVRDRVPLTIVGFGVLLVVRARISSAR